MTKQERLAGISEALTVASLALLAIPEEQPSQSTDAPNYPYRIAFRSWDEEGRRWRQFDVLVAHKRKLLAIALTLIVIGAATGGALTWLALRGE